jgi:hypothetical protein
MTAIGNSTSTRYYRKVIKIKAEDSPNVRLGFLQKSQGKAATNHILIPGVLPYRDYLKRRSTWDKVRQCVSLDAEFYEGAEVLLYPPDWLNRAELIARGLPKIRKAKAIGIDPAEGGDKTAMAAVDELGLIELVSKKTPDTAIITSEALAFMQKHGVPAHKVAFDRGGGGKQHADRLRAMGHMVNTVAFGETIMQDLKRGIVPIEQKKETREERYTYVNRRAEMYGTLRELLDPSLGGGFGLPVEYMNPLRLQLAPIPLTYDPEGRLYILPKHKKNPDQTTPTLVDIIGHSPDEADALVLAIYAMTHKIVRVVAGAMQ